MSDGGLPIDLLNGIPGDGGPDPVVPGTTDVIPVQEDTSLVGDPTQERRGVGSYNLPFFRAFGGGLEQSTQVTIDDWRLRNGFPADMDDIDVAADLEQKSYLKMVETSKIPFFRAFVGDSASSMTDEQLLSAGRQHNADLPEDDRQAMASLESLAATKLGLPFRPTAALMDSGGFSGFGVALARGVATGVVDLPKFFGEVAGMVIPGEDGAERFADSLREYQQENLTDPVASNITLADAWKNPRLLGRFLAFHVGRSLPTTAPGLGVAKLGQLKNIGRLGQIVGSATASSPIIVGAQLEDAAIDSNGNRRRLTFEEYSAAVGSGLVSAALEGVADFALINGMKRLFAPLDDIRPGMANAALGIAGKKMTNDLAKAIKDRRGPVAKFLKAGGQGAFVEGVTEYLQNIVEKGGFLTGR